MNPLLRTLFVSLVLMTPGIPSAFAQPGQGYQCPGCDAQNPGAQDIREIISDLTGASQSDITVTEDGAPGVFSVQLQNDNTFVVAPVGPLFRYQNSVQRRLVQTDEGSLRLRSQSRAELQIRAAIHNEPEVIQEMLRLGWDNFYWHQYGWEVDSPAGVRYCFTPDMQVSEAASPPPNAEVSIDEDGNLVIVHIDGIHQRLHACAHDFPQLRDRLRSEMQQQLRLNYDGTFVLTMENLRTRYRLNAELRWTGILDQPGFLLEGERILLRYRDGWEQELVELD